MSDPRADADLPSAAYVICATPRSGSTLLCGMLAATKTAGQPDSFYRQASITAWARGWSLDEAPVLTSSAFNRAYLAAALSEGCGDTSCFGMRLMYEDLHAMSVQLGTVHSQAETDLDRFEQAFGPVRFVHLSRRDRLAQAVSRVRAEQSGLWHRAADGSELERMSDPTPLRYDREAIQRHLDRLTEWESAWRDWFAAQGITPLSVCYEDLVSDLHRTVGDVLAHIGQDPKCAQNLAPHVQPLSDQTNRNWISRYRSDTASGP